METAEGARQLQLSDNRTLIKLSIFQLYMDLNHNHMFLITLFLFFKVFYPRFIF